MEYFCVSDVGLIRPSNQDSYLCLENEAGDLLALVCDGVGGAKAGEVASGEVIQVFLNEFKKIHSFASLKKAQEFLEKTTQKANLHIFKLAQEHLQYHGMGTTLTGILITKHGSLTINVGDSRVYEINDSLTCLTSDHTLVNEMLQNHEITYEESLNHPKRHFLTRAMGIFDWVKADIYEVKDANYFLVCSDGLHGFVSEEKIKKIIIQNQSVEEKTKLLLQAALLEGGYDNITIVLVKKHV